MVRIKHRYLLVQILYPNSTIGVRPDSLPRADTLVNATSPTLAFHGPTSDSVKPQTLLKLLRTELAELFGDYGAGTAGASLAVKYWSNATSTMIVRCDRAAFRLVWAVCTSIRSLRVQEGVQGESRGRDLKRSSRVTSTSMQTMRDVPCVLQVLHVSGTIRKCEEEAIRRATALCGRLKGLDAILDAGIGNNELDDGISGGEEHSMASGIASDSAGEEWIEEQSGHKMAD